MSHLDHLRVAFSGQTEHPRGVSLKPYSRFSSLFDGCSVSRWLPYTDVELYRRDWHNVASFGLGLGLLPNGTPAQLWRTSSVGSIVSQTTSPHSLHSSAVFLVYSLMRRPGFWPPLPALDDDGAVPVPGAPSAPAKRSCKAPDTKIILPKQPRSTCWIDRCNEL
ncbi:hypothetical protein BC834DRAFT_565867 [Gloeopeniophorella convolvens]|nr:hypothetical protein BC834DRAFT_565867 [Gloeopeniophorella convolvens]